MRAILSCLLLLAAVAAAAAAAVPDLTVAPLVSVSFPDLCADDASTQMSSVVWSFTNADSSYGAGSLIEFDLCGAAPSVGFARLILNDRWTGGLVANFAIPIVTSTPDADCAHYAAWTNLPLIAGAQIKSELRAVTSGEDEVNYVARRCIV
jgi:hypothetical protein